MLGGRKVVLITGTAALTVASPLAYMLGTADVGTAVSASIAAATAAAALAVPLWPNRSDSGAAAGATHTEDVIAMDTGRAEAHRGGKTNSGARRRRGAGGLVRAERTGSAIARGPGSHANSGVEEVDEW